MLLSSRYKNKGKLGSGTYGIVYLGKGCEGEVAIKRNLVDKGNTGFTAIREMSAIVVLGEHPNIVRFIGLSENPFGSALPKESKYIDDQYYMVFEKEECNGRSFFSQKRTPLVKKQFVVQSVAALTYFHLRLFMHLDIKPDNFLITYKRGVLVVKLCDLGMASEMNVGKEYCGGVSTHWYRAPEIIKGKKYDEKADFYSLGVTILEIMNGKNFMERSSDNASLLSFFTSHYPSPFTQSDLDFFEYQDVPVQNNPVGIERYIGMSHLDVLTFNTTKGSYTDFVNFLTFLIRINPSKRLDAVGIFTHPFMSECGQKMITRNNDINTRTPPVLCPVESIDCVERSYIKTFQEIFNKRSSISWYNHKMIFTAIDIYDRYLSRLYRNESKTPKTVPRFSDEIQIIPEGKKLTEQESVLLPTVIIYLSLKYHTMLSLVPSLRSIMPVGLDKDKSMGICLDLESRVLESMGFKLYFGTFFTCLGNTATEGYISKIISNYVADGPKYNGLPQHEAVMLMIE
jgi:serine/threonine protein kinase